MDDTSETTIHIRPFVESWQQEFVRKIFHKSQLERFFKVRRFVVLYIYLSLAKENGRSKI